MFSATPCIQWQGYGDAVVDDYVPQVPAEGVALTHASTAPARASGGFHELYRVSTVLDNLNTEYDVGMCRHSTMPEHSTRLTPPPTDCALLHSSPGIADESGTWDVSSSLDQVGAHQAEGTAAVNANDIGLELIRRLQHAASAATRLSASAGDWGNTPATPTSQCTEDISGLLRQPTLAQRAAAAAAEHMSAMPSEQAMPSRRQAALSESATEEFGWPTALGSYAPSRAGVALPELPRHPAPAAAQPSASPSSHAQAPATSPVPSYVQPSRAVVQDPRYVKTLKLAAQAARLPPAKRARDHASTEAEQAALHIIPRPPPMLQALAASQAAAAGMVSANTRHTLAQLLQAGDAAPTQRASQPKHSKRAQVRKAWRAERLAKQSGMPFIPAGSAANQRSLLLSLQAPSQDPASQETQSIMQAVLDAPEPAGTGGTFISPRPKRGYSAAVQRSPFALLVQCARQMQRDCTLAAHAQPGTATSSQPGPAQVAGAAVLAKQSVQFRVVATVPQAQSLLGSGALLLARCCLGATSSVPPAARVDLGTWCWLCITAPQAAGMANALRQLPQLAPGVPLSGAALTVQAWVPWVCTPALPHSAWGECAAGACGRRPAMAVHPAGALLQVPGHAPAASP